MERRFLPLVEMTKKILPAKKQTGFIYFLPVKEAFYLPKAMRIASLFFANWSFLG